MALPATVAAGSGVFLPTEFFVNLGESCLQGRGAGEHEIKVKLYNGMGTFKSSFTVETDVDGYWENCFWAAVNPGDRLWASDGSTSRSFTVPDLTLKVNRVTDVVSGTAPSHSEVFVLVDDCQLDNVMCSGGESGAFLTNGKGNFSHDFSGTYNIRGGDRVAVGWETPQGDNVEVVQYAPALSVQVGEAHTWGTARPLAQVKMWLFNKQGKQLAKYTTRAAENGEFGGRFKVGKKVVDVEVGYFVGSDIAGDALFAVIATNAHFDVGSNQISGKCFANSGFYVYLTDEHHEWNDWLNGAAAGNGSFAVDTDSISWDLSSGDQVAVVCRLPSGDDQATNYEVP